MNNIINCSIVILFVLQFVGMVRSMIRRSRSRPVVIVVPPRRKVTRVITTILPGETLDDARRRHKANIRQLGLDKNPWVAADMRITRRRRQHP